MGVPMRRPTTASAEQLHPDDLSPVWFDVFRFCDVRELGYCLAASRAWQLFADSPNVWADAYERTQRADTATEPLVEGRLRALIARPFGEDAVGWRVAVLVEDGTERYVTGHIVSYRPEADAYLVCYGSEGGGSGLSPPREVWEQERRKRTAAMRHNPSLAGKSRFSFLAPPARAWPHRLGPACAAEGGGARLGAPLRMRSWKEELEHNVRNAPSKMLLQLKEHNDEVLFVVFSPCGARLASCSRDLRTVVFRARGGSECGGGSTSSTDTARGGAPGQDRGDSASSGVGFRFEREAVITHQTAPCRAAWWPVPPHDILAVSTEDAGWQGASKVEIWQVLSDDAAPTQGADSLPTGLNARCLFQAQNRPFDIYAAVLQWPPAFAADTPPAAGPEVPRASEREPDHKNLCFLAGWTVFRENERYVQWLNVWPGPQHPRFSCGHELAGGGQNVRPGPLARIRLEGEMNYLHCLEVGPGSCGQRVLAMTGRTPHLCDEIGLIDLAALRRREDGGPEEQAIPAYDAPVEATSLGERVVLSAKWSQRGNFILLNTRPYAHGAQHGPVPQQATAGASFEDLLSRPAPDLSTSMELLLLDSATLQTVSVFDGHFAFTTKESPFLIFTDEWADSDFLASGGEDHRVYVWHRRHRRLIRRLHGHTEPVNAVSWSGTGLLASASDDHSIIIWASRGGVDHQ